MDRLNEALEHHTTEIENSLQAARAEREALRARDLELTNLIERAETLLGLNSPTEQLTLHDAVTVVLNDRNNEWTKASNLAAEVNRRRLYHKRDRSPVESNQIHAVAANYSDLFEKNQQRIRLRTGDKKASDPAPLRISKYDGLRDFLLAADEATITITFDDVADLVGSLPKSAWGNPTFWKNDSSGSHVQSRSWLAAGFRVRKIDQREGWVRFERLYDDERVVFLSGDAPST